MAPNSPRARRPGGARSARTSLGDRLRAWRHHHRTLCATPSTGLRAAPSSALMTVLVIAIALGAARRGWRCCWTTPA